MRLRDLVAVRLPVALCVAFIIGGLFGGLYLRDFFWKSANDSNYVFGGDYAANVAGANYFQQQDWQFPLFDFDNYRYPEGGSLIFSDGIPLVGFWVKLLYPLHGKLIDYLGWYVLVCFGLQSLAFVFLMRQLELRGWGIVVFGSMLAVAAPILLHRYGHSALCSHYWILFAIGLYFQQRKAQGNHRWFIYFYLLVIGALLTHPYLFIMVGFVFAAACMDALFRRDISFMRLTGLTASAFGGLFLVMIVGGYLRWDIEMQSTGGFGYYSTNLLSPFWPQRVGWAEESAPLMTATPYQTEGFAWLGTGVWFLFLCALFLYRRQLMSALRKHCWLGLFISLLSLLAIGNQIYLGQRHLVTIPLPENILDPLQTFRTNGRFIWPAIYAILVFAVAVIGRQLPIRKATVILAIGTALQCWDVGFYIRHNPRILERSEQGKVILQTERSLIARHERLVLLPSYHHADAINHHDLLEFYLVASQLNKPISSSYLARSWDRRSSDDDRKLYLSQGLQDNTLYWFMGPRFGLKDAARLDPSGKFIRTRTNQVIVSSQLPSMERELPALASLYQPVEFSAYTPGDVVDLADGHGMNFLLAGIHSPGDWSVGDRAAIRLPLKGEHEDLIFNGQVWAFLSSRHPRQRVMVYQGGKLIHERTFEIGESMPIDWSFTLDAQIANETRMVYLEFKFPDAISPQELGLSEDPRALAIQLKTIQVIVP